MPRTYTLREIRDLWNSQEERSRRDYTRELLDLYFHKWKPRLQREIDRLFTRQNANKLNPRADTSLNLARWASDEQGKIFSKPPVRSLLDNESADLAAFENGELTNLAFNTVAKQLMLFQELILRPRFDGTGVVWEIIKPHRVSAFPNPSNPLELDAICIQVPPEKKGSSSHDFLIYTTEVTVRVDHNWKVMRQESNTYGVIPYYVVHACYPAQLWNVYESLALRDATIATGLALTDFRHVHRLQSFKQVVLQGVNKEELGVVASDPSLALLLPREGQDAKTLDLQVDIRSHLETVLAAAGTVLNTKGINPAQLRGNLDASSGYALKLKLQGLEEIWREQRVLWGLWSNKLYQIARAVLLIESKGRVTLPEGELVTEFADIGPGENPTEQSNRWQTGVQNGWESARSVMRQQGKSDDEINEIEEDRMQEALMQSRATSQAFDSFSSAGDGAGA